MSHAADMPSEGAVNTRDIIIPLHSELSSIILTSQPQYDTQLVSQISP